MVQRALACLLSLALLWGCGSEGGGRGAPDPGSEGEGEGEGGGGKEDGPGGVGYWSGRELILEGVSATQLGNTRRITIRVPEGYRDGGDERYPVLYMHDGQNLFDAARASFGVEWEVDETVDWLVSSGRLPPLIVVAVDNTPGRDWEYTPSFDPSLGEGGDAAAYAHFLVEELKPWVDASLRTLPGRDSTGVMGSSLGGLVSWYLARQHPEVFGRIGCMSTSFWWNGREALAWAPEIAARWPEGSRIWLDSGTAEGGDADGDGVASMVEDARAARDGLLAGGLVFGQELGFLEGEGEEHTEAAWAWRLPGALTFLFAERPLPAASWLGLRVVRPRLAIGEETSVAVDASYGGLFSMTLPPRQVELMVAPRGVVELLEGTVVRGATAGFATLVAAHAGLEADADVEVLGDAGAVITLSFVVEVPEGTPEGAQLFLAGDAPEIGAWDAVGFELTEQPDGRFTGSVVLARGAAMSYKVTRGSWDTVEKGAGGEEIPDRQALRDRNRLLRVQVARWADQ